MPRISVDLDPSLLRELRRRARERRQPLARVLDDLLRAALAHEAGASTRPFVWISRRMGARVDLGDGSVVLDACDRTA
jgi:hypothetical protein